MMVKTFLIQFLILGEYTVRLKKSAIIREQYIVVSPFSFVFPDVWEGRK